MIDFLCQIKILLLNVIEILKISDFSRFPGSGIPDDILNILFLVVQA